MESLPTPIDSSIRQKGFRYPPIAVELGERQNLLLKGSTEPTVFVDLRARSDLDEAKRQLAAVIAPGDSQAFLQGGAG